MTERTGATTPNADEIFRIAEQVERNGARFYRSAAQRFGEQKKVRELLERLARMEDDHERTFAELRTRLVGDDTGWVDDGDQMAASYLHALVQNRFFDPDSDVTAIVEGADNVADVLEAAVRLETASIVFYAGIREGMPAAHGRDKLDAIIREEMSHVTTLSEELELVRRR